MNVWLVPASDEAATINLSKSLSRPVPPAALAEHGFSIQSDIYAWGARPGKNSTLVLDKMKCGDLCIFYTQGPDSIKTYHWAGIVHSARQSPELSQSIWQTRDFELVFFLSKRWPLGIPKRQVNQTLGYDPDFVPKGLMRADRDAATIAKAYELLGASEEPPVLTGGSLQRDSISATPLDRTEYIVKFCASRGFRFFRSTIRGFYASLRAKPFVILAGNSGTGKSRLARLFAEAIGANPANGQFQMIPVRPDWNDSSDLLGYFDLSGDYRPGQLISTLLLAHVRPEKPFFVCLDEMNLARVEHYFSDFLSILESRRKENGQIVTDAVLREEQIGRMKADSLSPSAAAVFNRLQSHPRPLGIPPNLFIVGTVNMDETTQPFSRKVLDRANTIEFNDIDLMEGVNEDLLRDEMPSLELSSDFLKGEFASLVDIPPDKKEIVLNIASFLQEVNRSLVIAGFEVGYRVRDESIAFTIYGLGAGMSMDEARENIVLQKVLPRLQGSSPKIEKALISLMQQFAGDEDISEPESPDFFERLTSLRTRSDASPVLRKIAGMLLIFREEGFTSYWLA
jgi:hypothetical protein